MKVAAKGLVVFAILFGLLITACADVCSDVELESAQQGFLDSMEIVNGLSKEYLGVETLFNYCPSSRIRVINVADGKKLKRLPRNINALTSLQELYLDSAGLDSLPVEIMELSKLYVIGLNGNHLCQVSPEMEAYLTKRNLYWKNRQICP